MAKHQVIRDVGLNLLAVLRAEMQTQRVKGKAFLATPTAEFLRKNSPCLVLYLYDLHPYKAARKNEEWTLEEEIVDEKGETVIVQYTRPLELTFKYLLTAHADELADEHELLAVGMAGLHDRPEIKTHELQGDSFFKGDKLVVGTDGGFTMDKALAIMGPLGSGGKLAVGYETNARLFTGKEQGRTRRVRQRHIDVFDPLRPPPGSVSAREMGLESKSPPKVAVKK